MAVQLWRHQGDNSFARTHDPAPFGAQRKGDLDACPCACGQRGASSRSRHCFYLPQPEHSAGCMHRPLQVRTIVSAAPAGLPPAIGQNASSSKAHYILRCFCFSCVMRSSSIFWHPRLVWFLTANECVIVQMMSTFLSQKQWQLVCCSYCHVCMDVIINALVLISLMLIRDQRAKQNMIENLPQLGGRNRVGPMAAKKLIGLLTAEDPMTPMDDFK